MTIEALWNIELEECVSKCLYTTMFCLLVYKWGSDDYDLYIYPSIRLSLFQICVQKSTSGTGGELIDDPLSCQCQNMGSCGIISVDPDTYACDCTGTGYEGMQALIIRIFRSSATSVVPCFHVFNIFAANLIYVHIGPHCENLIPAPSCNASAPEAAGITVTPILANTVTCPDPESLYLYVCFVLM